MFRVSGAPAFGQTPAMTTPRLVVALAVLLAAGCPKQASQTAEAEAPASTGNGEAETAEPSWPSIVLNGETMQVRWSDGDSFKFKSGPYEGKGVRLMGYNTLESYGPVHRWGGWTAVELYRIAKSSWKLAASKTWTCTTTGDTDHYGRVLVDCPDAAEYMVEQGHAVVFAIDGAPPESLVHAQKLAMKQRRGMWEKGAPETVITSLHSSDEGEGKYPTYNRVVNTNTGMSEERRHKSTYSTCEEVCLDGEDGSCMVYVPFEQRYRNKPECLIVKSKGGEPE